MSALEGKPWLFRMWIVFAWAATAALAPDPIRRVEGFASVEFHHDANRRAPRRDFRGTAPGYMTAGGWASGEMRKILVSSKTAPAPAKKRAMLIFIGAGAVLPSESRGPQPRLSVDGRPVLTFTTCDFTWADDPCELRYLSRRVEYPYFNADRQLELHGNTGICELTVPAEMIEAGRPALRQVELLPFPGWHHGWFRVKHRMDALQPSPASVAGEVDTLRRDMAVFTQQAHTLATQVYKVLPGTGDLVHDVVYHNDFRHLRGVRTPHTKPTGARVCFSRDNGKTWDIATEIQRRNDSGNWDVGYPESLQFPDSRVLTLYDYNLFGKYYGDTTWNPASPDRES